jgi:predicted metal-dependent HD superfamily phosphohydrolase
MSVDPIVRRAILSEVVVQRRDRETARFGELVTGLNSASRDYRMLADSANRTIRALLRVLQEIREGERRVAEVELAAPDLSDWTVGELAEAFGK